MSRVHRMEALWQDRVAEEVEKIREQNVSRRQEDIAKAWINNRSKIIGEMSRKENCGEMTEHMIPEAVNSGEGKVATVWTESLGTHEKGRKKQEVDIVVMPECQQPPAMVTWAPIQRNVLVENGQQNNIPYFGDDVIDRDSKFISSLVEEVNHKLSVSENITDELFLPLVSALSVFSGHEDGEGQDVKGKYVVLFRPDSDREKEWIKVSSADPSLPGLVVFQAIASKYPEFGTTDELIAKYKILTAQKAKKDLVANLDGPDATSMSAERAQHSYKWLLCRRCFLYDCPLHSDENYETPVPRLDDREELALPSQPCGPDCFKHLPGALAALSPRTPARINPNGQSTGPLLRPELCDELNPLREITGTERDVWTGAEETFYRVLAQSFPTNWCVIAQAMITKKCRQVYQFSLQDSGTYVKRPKSSGKQSKQKKQNKHKKVNTKAKQAALYKGHSEGGERSNNHTYIPCHHPGLPCTEDVCTCIQVGNFCEKYCYCAIECTHRFPGCKCKSKCTTNLCSCYLASRECDPDLCTTCLDSNIDLDPETNSCRNVVLQRGLGKKMYIAPSDIAGWGSYIGEKAMKNEFIAEYVGEMITQDESERRGKVYDKAKCSYMFNLNEDYCVDAARLGGKIRFANHSSKPNCKVKILMVGGDHRIGIYANRNIDVGEELFFNYGPDAYDLCYGLKPYTTGDEEEDEEEEVAAKPVRRRKKRRKNFRKLNTKEERELVTKFWKDNGLKNMGCFVKVKKYREPNTEDDLDSVDDLIKSSSESEGRPSSVEMISSEDEQDIREVSSEDDQDIQRVSSEEEQDIREVSSEEEKDIRKRFTGRPRPKMEGPTPDRRKAMDLTSVRQKIAQLASSGPQMWKIRAEQEKRDREDPSKVLGVKVQTKSTCTNTNKLLQDLISDDDKPSNNVVRNGHLPKVPIKRPIVTKLQDQSKSSNSNDIVKLEPEDSKDIKPMMGDIDLVAILEGDSSSNISTGSNASKRYNSEDKTIKPNIPAKAIVDDSEILDLIESSDEEDQVAVLEPEPEKKTEFSKSIKEVLPTTSSSVPNAIPGSSNPGHVSTVPRAIPGSSNPGHVSEVPRAIPGSRRPGPASMKYSSGPPIVYDLSSEDDGNDADVEVEHNDDIEEDFSDYNDSYLGQSSPDNNYNLLGCVDDGCENSSVIEEPNVEREDLEGDEDRPPCVISDVRTGVGLAEEDDWDDVLEGTEPECIQISSPRRETTEPSQPEVVNVSPEPEVVQVRLSPPTEHGSSPLARDGEPEVRLVPVYKSAFSTIAPKPVSNVRHPDVHLDPPERGQSSSGDSKPGRCYICDINVADVRMHTMLQHPSIFRETTNLPGMGMTSKIFPPPNLPFPTPSTSSVDPQNIDIYLDDDDDVETLD